MVAKTAEEKKAEKAEKAAAADQEPVEAELDGESPEDIASLRKMVKTVLADNKALHEQVEELARGGDRIAVDGGPRVIPAEQIKAFRKSKRPDTEYFILNPNGQILIRNESREYSKELGREVTTPHLFLKFTPYWDAGSELLNPNGQPLFTHGVASVDLRTWDRTKKCTDAEIAMFQAELADRREGQFGNEIVYTGEEFQRRIELEYTIREDMALAHEQYEKDQAEIRAGKRAGDPMAG